MRRLARFLCVLISMISGREMRLLTRKQQTTTAACIAISTLSAHAQEVAITPNMTKAEFVVIGQDVLIERNLDQNAVIDAGFAKTSRAYPPFCIHPMSGGEGVEMRRLQPQT